MGVVLSYRGAGVINLAAGAIAMLAGFFFWSIRLGEFATIPAVPAAILTLVFAAILGVVFDLLVVRPQRTAAPLAHRRPRRPAGVPGRRSTGIRTGGPAAAVHLAQPECDHRRRPGAGIQLLHRRHPARDHTRADGAVPVDAFRHRHEGGCGE
jgi:hypothetical protein